MFITSPVGSHSVFDHKNGGGRLPRRTAERRPHPVRNEMQSRLLRIAAERPLHGQSRLIYGWATEMKLKSLCDADEHVVHGAPVMSLTPIRRSLWVRVGPGASPSLSVHADEEPVG